MNYNIVYFAVFLVLTEIHSHDVCYDDIQETMESWTEPEPEKIDSSGNSQPSTYKRPLVTFHNKMGQPFELVWHNPNRKEPELSWGIMEPGKSASYSSTIHHRWYARDPETWKVFQDCFIQEDVLDYDFIPQEQYEQERKEYLEEKRHFEDKYRKENGRRWLSIYPRDPPEAFMWEPVKVGFKQIARTTAAFWYKDSNTDCDLSNEKDETSTNDEENDTKDIEEAIYHAPPPKSHTVTVETLSVSPAVFAFHDVMSEHEADLLIKLAKKKGMHRSLVTSTGIVSEARTSNNTWLRYDENEVVKNIFNRIADLMNIERFQLTPGHMAESIQVAHYATGQEYKDHHDYLEPAVHKHNGRIQAGFNRLATFLFYLNDVEEGGQTAFPLSDPIPGVTGSAGVTVRLPKGSAILFYNMLPDGNLDERCLHAGRPPTRGEKYIANLWLWDPKFQ